MVKLFSVLGFSTLFIIFIFLLDKKKNVDPETADNWHKDPNNWKLGIFYFNPQDKRLLPPKRMKAMGWTINFGNPFSILAIIVLLGIIWLLEASL